MKPASSAATMIEDPVAGWANDDLLLSDEARDHFRTNHSAAFQIFDWPQLRKRFATFDMAAGPARKRSRSGGVKAAMLGFAGLVVVSLMPMVAYFFLAEWIYALFAVAAAILAASGTILGYGQLLVGKRKAEWLTNRYWTERLRQLYFQFIINNLQLAVDTMRDPGANLAAWETARSHALADFEMRCVRPVTAAFKQMLDDEAEEEFWLNEHWRNQAAVAPASAELEEIFDLLEVQRFVIQRRFCDLKSKPGLYSVQSRAMVASALSDTLTVITLLITVLSGILIVAGSRHESFEIVMFGVTAQLCTAFIVLSRVLDGGLQLSGEAERYFWYRAAIEALSRRYSNAPVTDKVILLREMERLSYQEMRWFLNSFNNARFII